MLLIQTWLKLQKYKTMDCGLDLDPFYYPTYDFPTYDEVKIANLIFFKEFGMHQDSQITL
jgi:hypothetical protein